MKKAHTNMHKYFNYLMHKASCMGLSAKSNLISDSYSNRSVYKDRLLKFFS